MGTACAYVQRYLSLAIQEAPCGRKEAEEEQPAAAVAPTAWSESRAVAYAAEAVQEAPYVQVQGAVEEVATPLH